MKVGIVGIGIQSPWGCGADDLWESFGKQDCNIRPVVYGKDGEEKCFGYASLLPDKIRDGFDADFFGMHPGQVIFSLRNSRTHLLF